MPKGAPDGTAERQRIDKWLWHARVVRTRQSAALLVSSGHVRVNGRRIESPGQQVKQGDVVTVALDREIRLLRVIAFSERRRGAAHARTLYEDAQPKVTRSGG